MWPPNPSLQQQCVQRQDQKVREKTAFVGCQITQDDGSRDSWRRVERGESGGIGQAGAGLERPCMSCQTAKTGATGRLLIRGMC